MQDTVCHEGSLKATQVLTTDQVACDNPTTTMMNDIGKNFEVATSNEPDVEEVSQMPTKCNGRTDIDANNNPFALAALVQLQCKHEHDRPANFKGETNPALPNCCII